MDSRLGNLELTVQDLFSNTQSCNMCDFKGKTMKTHMTLKCKSEQNSIENTQTMLVSKDFMKKSIQTLPMKSICVTNATIGF